jgi:hypothetical protein
VSVVVRRQAIEPVRVVPNRCGQDVANTDKTRDAHIRLEAPDEAIDALDDPDGRSTRPGSER